MALRAVPEHPKFAALKLELSVSKFEALGILEALWHFVGKFTPRGNVGKFTDKQIEAWIEWTGEPGRLVQALTETGWIDLSADHRLIIHDWHEHADSTTKKQVGRTGIGFVQTCPDMSIPNGKRDGPPEPEPVPVPGTEPVPVPEPALRARTSVTVSRSESETLIDLIVISHPKSMQRSLQTSEVKPTDRVSVLFAMNAEIQRTGCSKMQALEMILELTRKQADESPPGELRFCKAIDPYFREFHYRIDVARQEKNRGTSKGKSEQTVDAGREFLKDYAHKLGLSQTVDPPTGPKTITGGL